MFQQALSRSGPRSTSSATSSASSASTGRSGASSPAHSFKSAAAAPAASAAAAAASPVTAAAPAVTPARAVAAEAPASPDIVRALRFDGVAAVESSAAAEQSATHPAAHSAAHSAGELLRSTPPRPLLVSVTSLGNADSAPPTPVAPVPDAAEVAGQAAAPGAAAVVEQQQGQAREREEKTARIDAQGIRILPVLAPEPLVASAPAPSARVASAAAAPAAAGVAAASGVAVAKGLPPVPAPAKRPGLAPRGVRLPHALDAAYFDSGPAPPAPGAAAFSLTAALGRVGAVGDFTCAVVRLPTSALASLTSLSASAAVRAHTHSRPGAGMGLDALPDADSVVSETTDTATGSASVSAGLSPLRPAVPRSHSSRPPVHPLSSTRSAAAATPAGLFGMSDAVDEGVDESADVLALSRANSAAHSVTHSVTHSAAHLVPRGPSRAGPASIAPSTALSSRWASASPAFAADSLIQTLSLLEPPTPSQRSAGLDSAAGASAVASVIAAAAAAAAARDLLLKGMSPLDPHSHHHHNRHNGGHPHAHNGDHHDPRHVNPRAHAAAAGHDLLFPQRHAGPARFVDWVRRVWLHFDPALTGRASEQDILAAFAYAARVRAVAAAVVAAAPAHAAAGGAKAPRSGAASGYATPKRALSSSSGAFPAASPSRSPPAAAPAAGAVGSKAAPAPTVVMNGHAFTAADAAAHHAHAGSVEVDDVAPPGVWNSAGSEHSHHQSHRTGSIASSSAAAAASASSSAAAGPGVKRGLSVPSAAQRSAAAKAKALASSRGSVLSAYAPSLAPGGSTGTTTAAAAIVPAIALAKSTPGKAGAPAAGDMHSHSNGRHSPPSSLEGTPVFAPAHPGPSRLTLAPLSAALQGVPGLLQGLGESQGRGGGGGDAGGPSSSSIVPPSPRMVTVPSLANSRLTARDPLPPVPCVALYPCRECGIAHPAHAFPAATSTATFSSSAVSADAFGSPAVNIRSVGPLPSPGDDPIVASALAAVAAAAAAAALGVECSLHDAIRREVDSFWAALYERGSSRGPLLLTRAKRRGFNMLANALGRPLAAFATGVGAASTGNISGSNPNNNNSTNSNGNGGSASSGNLSAILQATPVRADPSGATAGRGGMMGKVSLMAGADDQLSPLFSLSAAARFRSFGVSGGGSPASAAGAAGATGPTAAGAAGVGAGVDGGGSIRSGVSRTATVRRRVRRAPGQAWDSDNDDADGDVDGSSRGSSAEDEYARSKWAGSSTGSRPRRPAGVDGGDDGYGGGGRLGMSAAVASTSSSASSREYDITREIAVALGLHPDVVSLLRELSLRRRLRTNGLNCIILPAPSAAPLEAGSAGAAVPHVFACGWSRQPMRIEVVATENDTSSSSSSSTSAAAAAASAPASAVVMPSTATRLRETPMYVDFWEFVDLAATTLHVVIEKDWLVEDAVDASLGRSR